MEEPAVQTERTLNANTRAAETALDPGLLGPRATSRSGRIRIPTPPSDVPSIRAFPAPAAARAAADRPTTDTEAAVARDTALASLYPMAPYPEWLSRGMNVVIAAIALLILAPVYLLVAVAVKLTSSGPIFYTQTRIGRDRRGGDIRAAVDRRLDDLGGQPFTIVKFRSMRVDAEASGEAVWATKHDSRVTPIGQFLRKTRLDEIPQLVNVLRGEMNIVGPRPERPSIVVRLRADIPEYQFRHRVKPGITGWAQINHSYDACLEDVRKKVGFDLEYIRRQGVLFDLKIMVMTLPVMLFKRGAH
jgi:lipopolysaccharide/colanic/teichoic acid biosynthesis glycosyltransferase